MIALIVDDEPISVDTLFSMIHWKALGISVVLKAYSMKQAQKIFENEPVDILICDIEMPHGSGLELIQWIKKQNYEVLSIILTSFPKFEYASEAVKLQIFEYVLKPVEYHHLEEILTRAIDKIREDRKNRLHQTQVEYWNDSQKVILQNFWDSIVSGKISSAPASIRHAADNAHIDQNLIFRDHWIALLRRFPDSTASQWSSDLWSFTISNIMEEIFPGVVIISGVGQDIWLVLEAEKMERSDVRRGAQLAIDAFSKILPAVFLFFWNSPCAAWQTNTVCNTLLANSENLLSIHDIVLWDDTPWPIAAAPEDHTDKWSNALLQGNTNQVLDDIHDFFDSTEGRVIPRETMEFLYHALLKCVYSCLEFYKIQGNFIQTERIDPYHLRKILDSVSNFIVWAETLLGSVSVMISSHLYSSPVINRVCSYIQDNLNGNLSRDVLAKLVHMNPDYLSFLFHQRMNCSLVEYINTERIRESKRLLLTTDLSIAEIAIQTGFQNISYFSKQFKRFVGQTPNQFRKQKARR